MPWLVEPTTDPVKTRDDTAGHDNVAFDNLAAAWINLMNLMDSVTRWWT